MRNVLVSYDPDGDVLYVSLRQLARDELIDHTIELDEVRHVDYDANDQPVGVEFLWASEGVNVDGVPRATDVAAGIIAFRQVPAPISASR